MRRDVLIAKEVTRGYLASDGVESAQPSAAVARAERFIETDMPIGSYAEQHDIDAAGLANSRFVFAAVSGDIRHRAQTVRDMNVFSRNIDVIKKVLVHPTMVTL